MPVSFLDRPAESNIINTYVQSPYQEILQAGLARQGRYDETLNALQANQEYLDQLQAIEGTAQEEYLNQSRKKIASIAEQYANKDLSNTYIRRQLRDEVRRNINPATINTIVQSKKNYDLRNKYVMEGKAKNMYYEPYEQLMDPVLNKSLAANQLYDYLPNLMQDPDTYIGETYYKNLEPTVSSNTEGNEIFRYTKRTEKDLMNLANRKILDFANTTQGQAILSVARSQGDKRSNEDILMQAMGEVAPEYVINNREHQGYVPEYITKGSGNDFSFTGGIPLINRNLGEKRLPKSDFKPTAFFNEYESLESKLKGLTPNDSEYEKTKQDLDFKKSQVESIANQLGIDVIQEKQNTYNMLKDKYKDVSLIYKITKYIDDNNITQSDIKREVGKPGEFTRFIKSVVEEDFDLKQPNQDIYMIRTRAGNKVPLLITSKSNDKYINTRNTLFSLAEDYLSSSTNYVDKVKKAMRSGEANIPRGYQESGYVAPQIAVKSGVGYVNNPFTGEEIQSQSYALLKSQQANPDANKVKVINGKDNKLKKFASTEDFEYNLFSAMPDNEGWFTTVSGKDAEGKLTGVDYKIYMTTDSEREAFGKDFLENGNFLEAWKLLNPQKAEYLYANKNNKEIVIPVTDFSSKQIIDVKVEHLPNGKYIIYDPTNPSNKSTELSLEQASQELYKMEFGSLQQLAGNDQNLYQMLNSEYNRNSR